MPSDPAAHRIYSYLPSRRASLFCERYHITVYCFVTEARACKQLEILFWGEQLYLFNQLGYSCHLEDLPSRVPYKLHILTVPDL